MKPLVIRACVAAAMLSAAPAAAQRDPPEADLPRLCSTGVRGAVQLAYKPYGNAVFGSDGLTCASVKPDPEAAERTAETVAERDQRGRHPAARMPIFVETGP